MYFICVMYLCAYHTSCGMMLHTILVVLYCTVSSPSLFFFTDLNGNAHSTNIPYQRIRTSIPLIPTARIRQLDGHRRKGQVNNACHLSAFMILYGLWLQF